MKWDARNISMKRVYDALMTYPYRFTREASKRSNWIKAKRRNAR